MVAAAAATTTATAAAAKAAKVATPFAGVGGDGCGSRDGGDGAWQRLQWRLLRALVLALAAVATAAT